MEVLTTIAGIATAAGPWAVVLCVVLYLVIQHFKTKNETKAKQSEAKLEQEKRQADFQFVQDTFSSVKEIIADFSEISSSIPEKTAKAVQNAIGHGAIHSAEEEKNNAELNKFMNSEINCLLNKTEADRAFMLSFHNGGFDLLNRGYQRMTMIHERFVYGLQPISNEYQQVSRSNLQIVYDHLLDSEEFFVDNLDDLKEEDAVTYQRLASHSVKSAYFRRLRTGNLITGIIGIEYCREREEKIPVETIKKYLDMKANRIMGAQASADERKGDVNG